MSTNINDFEIKVEERSKFGSNMASKLRKSGRVPATFSGKIDGENLNLHGSIDFFELNKYLASKTLFNKFTKINFGKKSYYAFAQVLNRRSLDEAMLNIEFILVDLKSDQKIEMVIPVVFEDTELCEEIKLGGILNKVLTSLPLISAPKNMPSYVRYSVKNSTAKKSITIKDLEIGENVVISPRNKTSTVATILAGRKKNAVSDASTAAA